jgi:hypothetical protein
MTQLTAAAPAILPDPSTRRLLKGLLASLLLHAAVLSLQFGVPGLRAGSGTPFTVRLTPLPSPTTPLPLPVPPAPAVIPPDPPPQPSTDAAVARVPAPASVPTPRGFTLRDPVAPAPPPPVPAPVSEQPHRTPRRRARRAPDAGTVGLDVIASTTPAASDFEVPLPQLGPDQVVETEPVEPVAREEVPDTERTTAPEQVQEQEEEEQRLAQKRLLQAAESAERERAQQLVEQRRRREQTEREQAEREQAQQLADRQRSEQAERERAQQLAEQRQREDQLRQQAAERQRSEQAERERAQQLAEQRQREDQLRQQAAERQRSEQAERERAQQLAEQRQHEEQLRLQLAERQRSEQAERERAQQLAEQRQREEQLRRQEAERQRAEQAERERLAAEAARAEEAREAARQAADAARRQAEEQSRMAQAVPGPTPGARPGNGGADVVGTGGALPRGALGGDMASRAREMLRGIDVGKAVPDALRPAEDARRGIRRALAEAVRRDAPLRLYADSVRQKIERNALLTHAQLSSRDVQSDPVVSVTVRSDGSVEDVVIVRSSGRPDVDDIIRRIVQVNARYSAFPPNVAAQYDVVELRRVWRFAGTLRLLEEVR